MTNELLAANGAEEAKEKIQNVNLDGEDDNDEGDEDGALLLGAPKNDAMFPFILGFLLASPEARPSPLRLTEDILCILVEQCIEWGCKYIRRTRGRGRANNRPRSQAGNCLG